MPRGSKPGERRGGRKKGVPNKVTRELKDLARVYTEEAVLELARIARKGKSEQARVAAVKELLDRGWGKAKQPIEGTEDGPPVQHRIELVIID